MATFSEAAAAIASNPELAASLKSVTDPAKRAELLRAAGVTPPSHSDINSHLDGDETLEGISAGKNTTTAAIIAASAADAAS
jgi:hypothetical protein